MPNEPEQKKSSGIRTVSAGDKWHRPLDDASVEESNESSPAGESQPSGGDNESSSTDQEKSPPDVVDPGSQGGAASISKDDSSRTNHANGRIGDEEEERARMRRARHPFDVRLSPGAYLRCCAYWARQNPGTIGLLHEPTDREKTLWAEVVSYEHVLADLTRPPEDRLYDHTELQAQALRVVTREDFEQRRREIKSSAYQQAIAAVQAASSLDEAVKSLRGLLEDMNALNGGEDDA